MENELKAKQETTLSETIIIIIFELYLFNIFSFWFSNTLGKLEKKKKKKTAIVAIFTSKINTFKKRTLYTGVYKL
jgi:hypothetical protein